MFSTRLAATGHRASGRIEEKASCEPDRRTLAREDTERPAHEHTLPIMPAWNLQDVSLEEVSIPITGSAAFFFQWQKPITVGVTSEIERLLWTMLSERVQIQRPSEVRSYLTRHSDMIEVLVSAYRIAKDHLGPQSRLSLEVYRDPEIEDEQLILYVRRDKYDPEFFKEMEIVRTEYLPRLTEKSGWLQLTTDFQPPRS